MHVLDPVHESGRQARQRGLFYPVSIICAGRNGQHHPFYCLPANQSRVCGKGSHYLPVDFSGSDFRIEQAANDRAPHQAHGIGQLAHCSGGSRFARPSRRVQPRRVVSALPASAWATPNPTSTPGDTTVTSKTVLAAGTGLEFFLPSIVR
jgi:hypothetical protein